MRNAQAIGCSWSGGLCKMVTKDPSGLCYHHRRFSASTGSVGDMSAPQRMAMTSSIMSSNPTKGQGLISKSQAAMSNRPKASDMLLTNKPTPALVVAPYYSDTVEWDGETRSLPYRDAHVEIGLINHDGSNILVINYRQLAESRPKRASNFNGPSDETLQAEAEHDNNVRLVMLQSEAIADTEYANSHLAMYGMEDGLSIEEYDDVSEALGQLELGRIANGTLTVSTMSVSNQDDTVSLRFKSGDRSPSFTARVESRRLARMGDGMIGTRFVARDVQVEGGVQLDAAQTHMLSEFVRYRNMVQEYGYRTDNPGRVMLPVGWASMPDLEFRQ